MGMTTGLIDEFTEELLFEDELAPKTVHDVLVVLHGILKYTAAFFTGGFPAIEINYPKPGKKEMRVLSREEQTRFVSYLLDDMDTCKFGVLLTLFTGVRIGELCALQWGNISLKEQTIRIDATLQRLRDTSTADNPGSRTRIVIGTPKSDTSIRTIPITDYTAELCGKMNPHSSAAYVLTGTENYMEPLRFVTRLGKLCIIELLLHEQIGIFRLQALDGGQLFQRQIVKRLLRCLVDEDVTLMRIVVFLGIPGLAIGGVDISGLSVIDDVRFQYGDLCHTALRCLYFRRQLLRPAACGIRIIGQRIEICKVMLLDEQQRFGHAFRLHDFQLLVIGSAFAAADFGFNL